MLPADHIFSIQSEEEFEAFSLEIFRFQAHHCAVYAEYLALLDVDAASIGQAADIPFLPIELFKSHRIIAGGYKADKVFSSSGTTGMVQSRHEVVDLAIYERSFREAFRLFYGDPQQMAILALLPSYLERSGSSLIHMVDDLILQSRQPHSGYFLYNHQELFDVLRALQNAKTPTLLIGVTYALLDFVEKYRMVFPELIVMETGGMKGKRKELIRSEVHGALREGFGVEHIHSEYGMTELLSQAYSTGNGLFRCPPWMKVLVRETNDPFALVPDNKTGALNIIDLANIYSCSFIATQDLGKIHPDGSFEVLGRFDNSDIRGCNLLVE